MSKLIKSLAAGFSLLGCLAADSARATVYYWNPQGTTITNAPGGIWTGGAQWSTTSAQTASPVAWTFGYAACFAAGSAATGTFAVTLTNEQYIAGIYNGALSTPGCFLTLNGSGSLFLISGADAFDTGGSDGGPSSFSARLRMRT